jgi:GntR family transcriptional regulator
VRSAVVPEIAPEGTAPDPPKPAGSPDVDGVVRWLRRHLADGEFRPTERVGGERELAEACGVPRTLLRQALARLEAEGRIGRKIGRSGGVFAADGKIERTLNTIQGIPDLLRQQGIASATRLLEAGIVLASRGESRALEIEPGANVYRVVRVRLADGVPWSHEVAILPAARFPGLLTEQLEGSLYEIFQRVYDRPPWQSDESIDVVAATRAQADELGVPAGAPLLAMCRVTRSADGVPIEFARDHFRADRTRTHARKYGFAALPRTAPLSP